MGAPMAQEWQILGNQVSVWNRTLSKAEPLATYGIKVSQTPSEALVEAQVLVLMLSDYSASQAVVQTFSSGELRNKTILQMGTLAPEQNLALQEFIRSEGGHFLEAPVLGSIAQVKAHELICMVGGEESLCLEFLPILEQLCKSVKWIGPVGSASSLKLALNQMIPSLLAVFGLSLEFVRASGVPVSTFMEILEQSALNAPTFAKKLPRYLSQDYTHPNFPVRHMLKDLALFESASAGMDLNTGSLMSVKALLNQAAEAGFADQDYSALLTSIKN